MPPWLHSNSNCVAPGGDQWVRMKVKIPHPSDTQELIVLCRQYVFFKVKVLTPTGIATWTTVCFSKVVLNIEFKGMYKKAGTGFFLNFKSVRSIFFSFGHTIITCIHKVSVFVVSDCPWQAIMCSISIKQKNGKNLMTEDEVGSAWSLRPLGFIDSLLKKL